MRWRSVLAAVIALAYAAGGAPVVQAGGGACSAPISNARGTTLVELRNACFTPTVLHVQAGATVVWVNRDDLPHTVTGANLAWGSAQQLVGGAIVAYRFPAPGTYAFSCILHPGMLGVVVAEGPADAAAGDSATNLVPPQAVGNPVAMLSATARRLLRMLDGAL